jgi:hypothetical protein
MLSLIFYLPVVTSKRVALELFLCAGDDPCSELGQGHNVELAPWCDLRVRAIGVRLPVVATFSVGHYFIIEVKVVVAARFVSKSLSSQLIEFLPSADLRVLSSEVDGDPTPKVPFSFGNHCWRGHVETFLSWV